MDEARRLRADRRAGDERVAGELRVEQEAVVVVEAAALGARRVGLRRRERPHLGAARQRRGRRAARVRARGLASGSAPRPPTSPASTAPARQPARVLPDEPLRVRPRRPRRHQPGLRDRGEARAYCRASRSRSSRNGATPPSVWHRRSARSGSTRRCRSTSGGVEQPVSGAAVCSELPHAATSAARRPRARRRRSGRRGGASLPL